MIAFPRMRETILLSVVILLIHNQSSYSLIAPASNIVTRSLRLRKTVFLFDRRDVVNQILKSSRDEETDQSFAPLMSSQQKSQDISASTYITVFGILPVVSFFAFDQLLKQVTDFNLAAIDRQLWIIALLLSKRLYIYAVALTTVDLAAKRSVDLPGSLGKRLFSINGEIFNGIPLLDQSASPVTKESEELYAKLDTIDDTTQATALPIIVAGSLFASFILLGVTSSINQSIGLDVTKNIDINFIQQIQQQLGPAFLEFISALTLFWNAAVCSLFSKAEIQAAFTNILSSARNIEDGESSKNRFDQLLDKIFVNSAATPFILSLFISLISFVSLPGGAAWPIQNILNICIAITVARAAQLPRLPYIVLALVGLVFYDVIAVVGTQQFTDGGASIMEAVARAKAGMTSLPPPPSIPAPILSSVMSMPFPDPTMAVSQYSDLQTSTLTITEAMAATARAAQSLAPVNIPSPSSVSIASVSTWRPGLFEVVVGGRVSDVLGLADVVFPSMLAGWSLRYDTAKRKSFETEKENSKKIIETSLIQNFVEENENENDSEIESVAKLSLFDRVRNIFRVEKIVLRQINREVSKEKQRDRNIRIIIEEEKIENLDRKLELDLRSSVFSSSLIGYGLGCFLCEVFQTGEGQPALLFIVPSMLITVFITGLIRGEITEMWSYSPKIEEN